MDITAVVAVFGGLSGLIATFLSIKKSNADARNVWFQADHQVLDSLSTELSRLQSKILSQEIECSKRIEEMDRAHSKRVSELEIIVEYERSTNIALHTTLQEHTERIRELESLVRKLESS